MAKFQVEPHSFEAPSTYSFGMAAGNLEDAQRPKDIRNANIKNENGGMKLVGKC
jgi:hypothetical protein